MESEVEEAEEEEEEEEERKRLAFFKSTESSTRPDAQENRGASA